MNKFKKAMALLLTFVMVVSTFAVVPSTSVSAAPSKYVKSIKLNKSKLTMTAGKTAKIKATVKVKGSASKKVKVTLSKANKKVVKKAKVGKPNKKGQSTITFTAANVAKKSTTTIKVVTAAKNSKNKKLTKKIKVTVNPAKTATTAAPTTAAPTTEAPTTEAPTPAVMATGVTVNLAATEIVVGGTTKATAVVTPDNATNKAVTWSVDDTTYATIDAATGVITAKKEGAVTVKATAADGSGVSGTAKLTIKGTAAVALQKHNVTLVVGKSTTLTTGSIVPSDATVTYKSSNEKVAKVNASTGYVEAVAAGSATITASLKEYPSATDTCTVVVVDDSTMIVSNFSGLTQNGTFTVDVAMANDDNKVTDEMLKGSTLTLTNSETGSTITATYVSGSLVDGVATYAFDSNKIKSGTYTLSAGANSDIAVDSGNASDLSQTITVTELKTGICGYVYDYDNNPVAGAKVVCSAGDDTVATTTTDALGYYEMVLSQNTGYTITAIKEGYFTTSTEGIVVNLNKVNTCTMRIDPIIESEFTVWGQVSVSDKVDAAIDKNILPTATLYVEENGKWEYLAKTRVSSNGYYAFVNYNEDIMYNDSEEFVLPDDQGYKFTYANSYQFGSSAGLEKDKSYKVVINKDLSDDNLDAVYSSVSTEFSLSDTSKNTKVKDLTLVKVASFQGLTIPGGEITWVDDKCKPTGDTATLSAVFYAADVYYPVSGLTVKLNATKDASAVTTADENNDVTIVAKDVMTLPAGEYYVIVSCANCADVYKKITVDADGTAVELKDVDFASAVEYKLAMRILTNEAYFEKQGLEDGDSVKLMDLFSNVSANQAYLYAELCQVNGTEEIFIGSTEVDNFVVDDGAVVAGVAMNGLVSGSKYRVYFTSPVLSLAESITGTKESWSATGGYFEFTYSGEENNNLIPEFKTEANILNVKLTSAAQLEGFVENAPLLVNNIKLLDSNKKEIASRDINKYFSCGNYAELSAADKAKVYSDIYGGGDLIDNGILANFANLPAGKYYLQISINGYQALEIPTDGLELIGLCQGNYQVTSDYEFKLVPKTSIAGTIYYNNDPVATQVDITVLNAQGKVAAVGTSYDGTYVITNGVNGNVLNVGETYTLVFRSEGYAVTAITSDALIDGKVTADATMKKGTGSVTATIYEAETTNALTGGSAYALDNKYVDVNDLTKFVNAAVRDQYVNLDFNGVYKMSQSSNAAVWNVTGVPLGTYQVVAGGAKYVDTYSKFYNIDMSGGTADCQTINVPLATTIATTPVVINIKKDSDNIDLNQYGYDVLKIYSVDAAGNETLVKTLTTASAYEYAFAKQDLVSGNYVVYAYSRNYILEKKEITVSTNTEVSVEETIYLTPAK